MFFNPLTRCAKLTLCKMFFAQKVFVHNCPYVQKCPFVHIRLLPVNYTRKFMSDRFLWVASKKNPQLNWIYQTKYCLNIFCSIYDFLTSVLIVTGISMQLVSNLKFRILCGSQF